MPVTNQGYSKTIQPFWEVRAEMTAQTPNWLELPITLLECEARGASLKDS